MSKRTYSVEAPDGTVQTRTTERVYTHAVLRMIDPRAKAYGPKGVYLKPEFRGSYDLAVKLVSQYQKVVFDPTTGYSKNFGGTTPFYSSLLIVEVTVVEAK